MESESRGVLLLPGLVISRSFEYRLLRDDPSVVRIVRTIVPKSTKYIVRNHICELNVIACGGVVKIRPLDDVLKGWAVGDPHEIVRANDRIVNPTVKLGVPLVDKETPRLARRAAPPVQRSEKVEIGDGEKLRAWPNREPSRD